MTLSSGLLLPKCNTSTTDNLCINKIYRQLDERIELINTIIHRIHEQKAKKGIRDSSKIKLKHKNFQNTPNMKTSSSHFGGWYSSSHSIRVSYEVEHNENF